MVDNWVSIGREEEFADGLRTIAVGRQRIVVARLKGQLFAFDALCPHAQGPMERSEVEGAVVSCPLHAWRFDLEAGGKELHGYRDLPLHEIKVADGQVFLAVGS